MSDVQELNINNITYDIKAKSIVDTNSGKVKFWTGTKAQYDAIATKDANTLYNVEGVGLYKGTTLISNDGVSKSGDTMTGLLNINSADGYNSGLQFQHPDYETGSIPANNLFFPYFKFVDKNEKQLTEIYHTIRTTGESNFVINSKHISDSGSDKYIIMSQKTDGSFTFTFPNTTCCDGQYVNTNTTIASNVSVNGSSNLTYTLNLPSDGHKYMVWMIAEGDTGTTSGNHINIRLASDIMSGTTVAKATTRTASTVGAGGTVCLVVSSSHKIYLGRATNWNGTVNLLMIGYRRIGTNS